MTSGESQVMKLAEVAAHLRVHTSTIYRLLKKRQLPGFKVGDDWRFLRSDIEAYTHRQDKARRMGRGAAEGS